MSTTNDRYSTTDSVDEHMDRKPISHVEHLRSDMNEKEREKGTIDRLCGTCLGSFQKRNRNDRHRRILLFPTYIGLRCVDIMT